MTGEEGYLILRKPYDFDSTAKMGERGSFELNGRQKKMYLMPCFALTCLRKIDKNTTLHSDIIVSGAGGWLSGGNKLLQSLTYKYSKDHPRTISDKK
jgi:hypothetical protein